MELKKFFEKYIDLRLLGIISSLLVIISEFLPWISTFTLLERYILYTQIRIQDSFLYLFPLVSGIFCIFGNLLFIYKFKNRIKSVILNFVGIGFLIIFFFDFIPKELIYVSGAGIGFYFCLVGFILIIFSLINTLMLKED